MDTSSQARNETVRGKLESMRLIVECDSKDPKSLEWKAKMSGMARLNLGDAGVEELDEDIQSMISRIVDIGKGGSNKGIREGLLTCIIGYYLAEEGYPLKNGTSEFFPREDFYNMKPRGVWKPIKVFLDSHGIPCGKDGPLNMLKQRSPNEEWAREGKGKNAIRAKGDFVTLLRMIEHDPNLILPIFHFLMSKLMDAATETEKLSVIIDEEIEDEKIVDSMLDIIHEATDGGATPHNLVSVILSVSTSLESGGARRVLGEGESVHATDSTSKKPGDFAIEEDGAIVRVYEVTLKSFDEVRMKDSIKSLLDYEKNGGDLRTADVIVLCREQDTPFNPSRFGNYPHEGVNFWFMDIQAWIFSRLAEIGRQGRLEAFRQFSEYVNDKNTSPIVKEKWRELVS